MTDIFGQKLRVGSNILFVFADHYKVYYGKIKEIALVNADSEAALIIYSSFNGIRSLTRNLWLFDVDIVNQQIDVVRIKNRKDPIITQYFLTR